MLCLRKYIHNYIMSDIWPRSQQLRSRCYLPVFNLPRKTIDPKTVNPEYQNPKTLRPQALNHCIYSSPCFCTFSETSGARFSIAMSGQTAEIAFSICLYIYIYIWRMNPISGDCGSCARCRAASLHVRCLWKRQNVPHKIYMGGTPNGWFSS